jgi:hypothetical protein
MRAMVLTTPAGRTLNLVESPVPEPAAGQGATKHSAGCAMENFAAQPC